MEISKCIDSYIALGSNINNPSMQVDKAVDLIRSIPESKIVAISSKHVTKPYGYLQQNDFINSVLQLRTSLTAFDLLIYLQQIENKMGRVRSFTWGPRVIDLDILLYADQVISTASLKIPHPEMHKRSFVLAPLSEINSKLIIPVVCKSVSNLLADISL